MQFVDAVIDAETCQELAGLTEHQQLVCNLRWTMGFTLEQCGRLLGNSEVSVREAEEAAKNKMMKVLAEWGRKT